MQVKLYPILIVGSVLGLCPSLLMGDVLKPISVTWQYAGDAAFFRLYQDGNSLCESSGPDIRSMTCESLMGEDPISYTLTAVYTSGEEGPHSNPFIFDPPQLDPYGNYVPVPDLQASTTSGTAPLTVNFNASASNDVDGVIMEYRWDFGDGDVDYGLELSHTYYSAGTYTVTLTVTDDCGASASSSTEITVAKDPTVNEIPNAVITTTNDGTNLWKFDAYNSSDPDGFITSYVWSFGDGNSGEGEYVEHTFDIAGTYTVTLTVTDDDGETASSQESIIVEESAVAGQFPVSLISLGVKEQLVQVFWDYSDTSPINAYRLYQNDIPICETNDPESTSLKCLTYLENNPMTFAVTSIDNLGVESSMANTITYNSNELISLEGKAPYTVYFNGSLSSDADGEIVDYFWDFGDGEVSVAKAVEHTFTTKGQYNVLLTVTDNKGNEESSTIAVTVLGNIQPTVSDSAIVLNEDQTFTGNLIASDADGDTLIYSIVEKPLKGNVSITDLTSGDFSYIPEPNVSGQDSFTFKVNDSQEDSNTATVSITINPVNDPPAGEPLFLTTDSDTPVSGSLITSDPEDDILQYTIIENGSLGKAVISDSTIGEITYTPYGSGGTDYLSVQVSDGQAFINLPVTVEVIFEAENSPPVAQPDQWIVNELIMTLDVLANDSDPDGDPLELVTATSPDYGRVEIKNNQIVYYPNTGFTGTDNFNYTIQDSQGATDTAEVNLEVDTSGLMPGMQATFNWDYEKVDNVKGFKIYQDGQLICSTDNPDVRSLTCPIEVGNNIMTFAVRAVDQDNVESQISNELIIDFSSVREKYKQVTYIWEYDSTSTVDITGFSLYFGDKKVCETQDSTAREMTCLVPLESSPANFSLRAISDTGEESMESNKLEY